jgi:hypothetical protein
MKIITFLIPGLLMSLSFIGMAASIDVVKINESKLGYSEIIIKGDNSGDVKCVIYNKAGKTIGVRESWFIAPLDEMIILKKDAKNKTDKADCWKVNKVIDGII